MRKISKKKSEGRAEAVKAIEDIYNKYLKDLGVLQKKQDQILEDFSKNLERKRIEEIRKELKK